MSITLTINGVEMTCDSAEEAIQLARLASNGRPSREAARKQSGPGRPPKDGRSTISVNRKKQGVIDTLRFLLAVRDAGKHGADKDVIMSALDLKDARAIGGLIVRVNSVLDKSDIVASKTFRTRGTPGAKIWRAGTDIGEAIGILKERQEGGA